MHNLPRTDRANRKVAQPSSRPALRNHSHKLSPGGACGANEFERSLFPHCAPIGIARPTLRLHRWAEARPPAQSKLDDIADTCAEPAPAVGFKPSHLSAQTASLEHCRGLYFRALARGAPNARKAKKTATTLPTTTGSLLRLVGGFGARSPAAWEVHTMIWGGFPVFFWISVAKGKMRKNGVWGVLQKNLTPLPRALLGPTIHCAKANLLSLAGK